EARPLATPVEVRARLEGEHHAGEALVQLGIGDGARTHGRIVQVDLALAEALEHHEVVELPEQDQRWRELRQLLQLALETAGFGAIGARAPDDVARLAAVARDAAGDPQLLQRYGAAVVAEHDPQRGRAALDGLHLDDRWRAHPLVARFRGRLRRVRRRGRGR